ncbi:MAG: hypothetical protein MUF48_16585 [Pirellulaceae bacterium]|nr:hypothetical protein [Pirellulaceae bacterium]
MIPALEQYSWLAILYWVLVLLIAMVVLDRVTAFWVGDGPGTMFGAA